MPSTPLCPSFRWYARTKSALYFSGTTSCILLSWVLLCGCTLYSIPSWTVYSSLVSRYDLSMGHSGLMPVMQKFRSALISGSSPCWYANSSHLFFSFVRVVPSFGFPLEDFLCALVSGSFSAASFSFLSAMSTRSPTSLFTIPGSLLISVCCSCPLFFIVAVYLMVSSLSSTDATPSITVLVVYSLSVLPPAVVSCRPCEFWYSSIFSSALRIAFLCDVSVSIFLMADPCSVNTFLVSSSTLSKFPFSWYLSLLEFSPSSRSLICALISASLFIMYCFIVVPLFLFPSPPPSCERKPVIQLLTVSFTWFLIQF